MTANILRFPARLRRANNAYKRDPRVINIVIEQRADGSCAIGWNENIPMTREGMGILSDALAEALVVIKSNYFDLP